MSQVTATRILSGGAPRLAAPRASRAVLDACCNTIVDLIRDDDVVYADSMVVGDRLPDQPDSCACAPGAWSISERMAPGQSHDREDAIDAASPEVRRGTGRSSN
jgi:hypothetical protein